MYTYEWFDCGLLIKDGKGSSAFIQGEEGEQVYSRLCKIEDDGYAQHVMSYYDDVMEPDDGQ